MAHSSMISLAAFHLERDFLFTALVLHDVGDHAGRGHSGRTHSELPIFIDQEDPVKSERLPGFHVQALDFQRIARGDTILLTTSFQYGVHNKIYPFKRDG